MTPLEILAIAAVFVTTVLVVGLVATLLSPATVAQRRLEEMTSPRARVAARAVTPAVSLTDHISPRLAGLSRMLPTSPKEMSRIRRRLAKAGYYDGSASVIYAASEIVLPVLVGGALFLWLGMPRGILVGSLGAIVGYLAPGFILARMVTQRQEQLRHALPDALDLLIVCIEAGLSIDQALQKVSEELGVAHPALAAELHTLTNEVRAGKPRMEAFHNLAERTQVDDVRSLVAMLVQTDRFGTSIGQALRTHADTSRTVRRQQAEEKAAKLGIKLVFPLVFCLFPSMYVVTIGPGAIRVLRVMVQGLSGQ
jgi:tight adherence protein C